jgi:hypothetical protein
MGWRLPALTVVLETAGSGPAGLLRPDRETVEFTGRETELAALRSWCTSAGARSVLAIVGAGGVGKTRLALKAAAEWEAAGGEWQRIGAGEEACSARGDLWACAAGGGLCGDSR